MGNTVRPPLSDERRRIARERWQRAWHFALVISKMELDRKFNAAVHGVAPVKVCSARCSLLRAASCVSLSLSRRSVWGRYISEGNGPPTGPRCLTRGFAAGGI